MIPTYAAGASPAFNARLHADLGALTRDVGAALGDDRVALLLGGSYGRGEGSVVRRGGEERPFNDLDLFLVVRRRGAVAGDRLHRVTEDHGRRLGVEVDLSRPLTPGDLERLPPCLRWQDLLLGHVVLDGPRDILSARAPAHLRAPLPTLEATRLLLNRGAGLLWAMRVLQGAEPSPDADFVRRNLEKLRLALGDAVLISHQRFVHSTLARANALGSLVAEVAEVRALDLLTSYRGALRYRRAPDVPPEGTDPRQDAQDLVRRFEDVLLHVERRRTGRRFGDAAAYAAWTGLREPRQHLPDRWLANLVHNGRLGRLGLRYPREGLYRALPGLLREGGAPGPGWAARSEAFLRIGRRFN